MANIISTLISPDTLRMVDETAGLPVFRRLKVIEVEITVDAEFTDLPFASQTTTISQSAIEALQADIKSGKIIKPSKIKISAAANDLAMVIGIISTFNDVTSTFAITSRSITSNSMALVNIQLDQDSNMLDAVRLTLQFEQTAMSNATGYDPKQSGDKATYGVHVDAKASFTDTIGGLYNKVSKYIGL